MAHSATARLVLDGSEHDGTLAVVGMTTFEGRPRVVDELRPHPCMRWVLDPDHDAVMRIAAKLRGGGPILYRGIKAMLSYGTPPPRTVSDPSEACGVGCWIGRSAGLAPLRILLDHAPHSDLRGCQSRRCRTPAL